MSHRMFYSFPLEAEYTLNDGFKDTFGLLGIARRLGRVTISIFSANYSFSSEHTSGPRPQFPIRPRVPRTYRRSQVSPTVSCR